MDNAIFPNKFKAALAAHQVQIGCWCALANPISTEVLGLAGFDWLVLDAEHAPNDVTTLIPQLMALKGSSSAQVVRVPTNEPIIIKRMLDIGFYNFLVPFVETAEQAAQHKDGSGCQDDLGAELRIGKTVQSYCAVEDKESRDFQHNLS